MSIASVTGITRRELARRVNAGIEITLLWDARDNSTSIDVRHTATDELISFRVPADRALDAFHHPFATSGWRTSRRSSSPSRGEARNGRRE
jgi:hypothetical protein